MPGPHVVAEHPDLVAYGTFQGRLLRVSKQLGTWYMISLLFPSLSSGSLVTRYQLLAFPIEFFADTTYPRTLGPRDIHI